MGELSSGVSLIRLTPSHSLPLHHPTRMIFKKKPEQMTSLPASPELRTHGGPCLPFLGPPLAGLPSWPQSVSATGQEALPPAAFAPRVPWARNWIFSILHLSQIHFPRKPFLTAQPTPQAAQPVLSQGSEGTSLGYSLLSLPSLAGNPGPCLLRSPVLDPGAWHRAWWELN